MTEDRTYSDFDLIVEPADGDAYLARVLASPAGQGTSRFTFPFSELEVENFLLKLGRPRRGTRRMESSETEAARQFGARLFEAVFQDDVKLSLRRSLDEVQRRDEGLRIRLRFSDTPELESLPWEFLFSESIDQFLALSAWTPIIRYLDLTQQTEPLTVTGPLRILAMISAPDDYPTLDVEEEWSLIESSLAPLIDRGAVVVERSNNATLLELQRLLRQNEYHIFHYLGHGGFDEKAGDGVLVLEDEHNRSRVVSGRTLGTILSDHRPLQLAVLNACEGARTSGVDPFSGTAQSLVRHGIPAVVAMQFEITDEAAIAFAQEFYAAVADGLPVDAAIGEARRAIYGLGNDIEWGTPVLYLRGDGQLFAPRATSAPLEDTAAVPAAVVGEESDQVSPPPSDQRDNQISDDVLKAPPPNEPADLDSEDQALAVTERVPAWVASRRRAPSRRWVRVLGLGVAIAAVALLAWQFLPGGGATPDSYTAVSRGAEDLAGDAAAVNNEWDANEETLLPDRRSDLFGATLAGLQEIEVGASRLAVEAAAISPVAAQVSKRPEILAALDEMVLQAREMIFGLRQPRGEKAQRHAGLAGFLAAVDRLVGAAS